MKFKGLETRLMTQLQKELIDHFLRGKRYRTKVYFAEVWLRNLRKGDGVRNDNINPTSSICVVSLFERETPLVSRQSKVLQKSVARFHYYSYHF